MSSANFHEAVRTTNDMQSSYDAAVQRSAWDNEGNGDNNSGTIAGSFGVQREFTLRPLTMTEAYALIEKEIKTFSRHDSARAVALLDAKSIKERKIVKKLKITAKAIEEAGSLSEAIFAVSKASVTLRAGEQFEKTSITLEKGKQNLVKKYKISVETVEGKTEIRYFVRVAGQNLPFKWEDGVKTMAEARKMLVRYAEAGVGTYRDKDTSTEYEVVAHTMRDNGNPLIRAVRQISGAEVEVEITIVKVAANPVRGGWLFFGWTHE